MGIFADVDDLDTYVGQLFRQALADPQAGPRLRSAGVVLRIVCREPECEIVLRLHDPVNVSALGDPPYPVVTLGLRSDHIDGFLRGTYSLVEGIADEEIQVKGPVSRALRALASLETPLPYRRPGQAMGATPAESAPPRPRRADGLASRSNAGSAR